MTTSIFPLAADNEIVPLRDIIDVVVVRVINQVGQNYRSITILLVNGTVADIVIIFIGGIQYCAIAGLPICDKSDATLNDCGSFSGLQ